MDSLSSSSSDTEHCSSETGSYLAGGFRRAGNKCSHLVPASVVQSYSHRSVLDNQEMLRYFILKENIVFSETLLIVRVIKYPWWRITRRSLTPWCLLRVFSQSWSISPCLASRGNDPHQVHYWAIVVILPIFQIIWRGSELEMEQCWWAHIRSEIFVNVRVSSFCKLCLWYRV